VDVHVVGCRSSCSSKNPSNNHPIVGITLVFPVNLFEEELYIDEDIGDILKKLVVVVQLVAVVNSSFFQLKTSQQLQ
jgi:hypothetical protein